MRNEAHRQSGSLKSGPKGIGTRSIHGRPVEMVTVSVLSSLTRRRRRSERSPTPWTQSRARESTAREEDPEDHDDADDDENGLHVGRLFRPERRGSFATSPKPVPARPPRGRFRPSIRPSGQADMDLRVAIIGYGLAGRVFHAPLVAAEPRHGRGGRRDRRSRARARRPAADHPDARVVASADELWAAPDAIDLVVVAAPNRAHVPLARAAIAAGVPVVVDKPLAPDADDGASLVREAAAAGVLLSVFQNRRWDGDFLTVRRLLAEGAVGDVVRFDVALRPLEADRQRRGLARAARRRGRRRPAGRSRQPPDRSGDRALRPARSRCTPSSPAPGRGRGSTTTSSWPCTHPGGVRSHLGATMLAAAPGSADPAGGHGRDLREVGPRRSGGRPARRRPPRRSRVGAGARRGVGAPARRRRTPREVPDGAGRLRGLLRRCRPGPARGRAAARGPRRRRPRPARDRGRAAQRPRGRARPHGRNLRPDSSHA